MTNEFDPDVFEYESQEEIQIKKLSITYKIDDPDISPSMKRIMEAVQAKEGTITYCAPDLPSILPEPTTHLYVPDNRLSKIKDIYIEGTDLKTSYVEFEDGARYNLPFILNNQEKWKCK